MNILNNTSSIYYSEFLFKNYLKVWLKLLLINNHFLPYATTNLVRNKLNSVDLINSLINANVPFSTIKYFIEKSGKRNYNKLISNIINNYKIKLTPVYDTELIKLLVKYNSNNDYLQLIKLANRSSLPVISEYLIDYNTNFNYDTIVKFLSTNNKPAIIKKLINSNADIELIKRLLEIFFKLDRFNRLDYSSLINSLAYQGNLELIKLIAPYDNVKHYVDGIERAAKDNRLDIIRYLAPLNMDNKNSRFYPNLGQVIYTVIKKNLNPEIINIVEPYNTDKNYNIDINLAAKKNKAGIIRKLAPHDTDKNYDRAIEHLSKFTGAKQDLNLIEYLAKRSRNKDFGQIIDQAAQDRDIDLVKILAPLDAYKNFALAKQKALQNKDYEMVRFLDRLN